MNLEEKYKMFGLDNEKAALFKEYSAGINVFKEKSSTFTIKTVVVKKVGDTFEAREKDDAKLV
jgi:hypothetical protein